MEVVDAVLEEDGRHLAVLARAQLEAAEEHLMTGAGDVVAEVAGSGLSNTPSYGAAAGGDAEAVQREAARRLRAEPASLQALCRATVCCIVARRV